MSAKRGYRIDGRCFGTFEEFARHFGENVLDGAAWGENLNALNDVLRGGFNTPDGGFRLTWENSDLSRQRLGHAETARCLDCAARSASDPDTRRYLEDLADSARRGEGSTVFDWIVQTIRNHGEGGDEADDGIELELR
jgi:hypothetical protein